jgi:hypothetical protein
MPNTVNWTVSLQIPGGPRIGESGAVSVEAYDRVSVVVEAGATDVDVEVQPGAADGQVSVLAITASAYSANLTVSPDGGTTTFALEAPVALVGSGAVSLLAAAPQQVRLANAGAEAVTVDVLVGRDATP